MLASRVHDACSQSGGVTRKRPAAVTSRGNYRFNPKEPATSTVLRYVRYLKAMEPEEQDNRVARLDNTWPKFGQPPQGLTSANRSWVGAASGQVRRSNFAESFA